MKTSTYQVEGMDCGEEVEAIRVSVSSIQGVGKVEANLLSSKVTIEHAESVAQELLVERISVAGVKVAEGKRGDEKSMSWLSNPLFLSVLISGIALGTGLIIEWGHLAPRLVAVVGFGIAVAAGAMVVFPRALASLGRRQLDMNVLMTVAVIGAIAIGEWAEGAAVVFLFALSELLESQSIARSRRAIQSLLRLAPETALVHRDGATLEVDVKEVSLDEIVVIKSGARIPLDGVVVAGNSSINQAPITGESMPVEKAENDLVYAGTINGEGSLEVRVTKSYRDTTLAKIIRLVEEAQEKKAPSQRFVDVFACYYTPAVMVLALFVFLVPPLVWDGNWEAWTYRALVLLVIACPCALVISTPVSIVSGLTAMARRGVLIKGGVYLEAIGKLRALALDKTGTITEGKPKVTYIVPWKGTPIEKILRIAAAVDAHSTHPLAQTIVDHARESGMIIPKSDNYRESTGRGAEATLDGHDYFVGNHRFTHELAVCSNQLESKLADIEEQGQSVIVVGHKPHADCAGEVLGIVAVSDVTRPNAKEAIKGLHRAGIQQVVMLSGDNQKTVNAIAREVGIDSAIGDLLPDQKIENVERLLKRHRYVGMVGDGVNDAPAMAAATVGIAMGAAGTDTAIETADIALMQDDLVQVAHAIHLGRRTLHIIRFNIAFSLLIKALFLVLAIFGLTSLWLAIAADTGATLLVTANALRLLKIKAPA